MSDIVIVDYGAGNLRSVQNAFKYLGLNAAIVSDPDSISLASALVLPGQGSAAPAMALLKSNGMDLAIQEFVSSGKPFLGVCLGLQLLFDNSDEDDTDCLAIMPGSVRKFSNNQKVPQIGWNSVEIVRDHRIFEGISSNNFFYFANSYYVEPTNTNSILGSTNYGLKFCSVIAEENIVAMQFHPEKSGELALRLYNNFIKHYLRGSAT